MTILDTADPRTILIAWNLVCGLANLWLGTFRCRFWADAVINGGLGVVGIGMALWLYVSF